MSAVLTTRTLASACERGDTDEVARLLGEGVPANAVNVQLPDGTRVTPLLVAIMNNHAACAQLLISAHAALNAACGPDSESALHVCCARGHADGARVLIEAGAELGPADALGRSPLFMSCLSGKPDLTALLLKAGADYEQPMTKHNPGATPLYAAALSGSTRCVSLLCEAGADVEARTADGASPIMVSCQHGHLGTAMLLSSYGASRRRTAFHGCFPVSGTWAEDLAMRSGNTELVDWLRLSAAFCPLHHLEVLTPQRTVALLRSGRFSPHGGTGSPAERARTLPCNPSAAIVLQASAPWSPSTHHLWGWQHRALAVELLKIGYALRGARAHDNALLDVWTFHVMPHVVTWDAVPRAWRSMRVRAAILRVNAHTDKQRRRRLTSEAE